MYRADANETSHCFCSGDTCVSQPFQFPARGHQKKYRRTENARGFPARSSRSAFSVRNQIIVAKKD